MNSPSPSEQKLTDECSDHQILLPIPDNGCNTDSVTSNSDEQVRRKSGDIESTEIQLSIIAPNQRHLKPLILRHWGLRNIALACKQRLFKTKEDQQLLLVADLEDDSLSDDKESDGDNRRNEDTITDESVNTINHNVRNGEESISVTGNSMRDGSTRDNDNDGSIRDDCVINGGNTGSKSVDNTVKDGSVSDDRDSECKGDFELPKTLQSRSKNCGEVKFALRNLKSFFWYVPAYFSSNRLCIHCPKIACMCCGCLTAAEHLYILYLLYLVSL